MTYLLAKVTLVNDPIYQMEFPASLRDDLRQVNGVANLETISTQEAERLTADRSKSSGILGTAGILLTVTPLALQQTVQIIKMWIERQSARSVVIEIEGDRMEIHAATRKIQQDSVNLFLARHGSHAITNDSIIELQDGDE